MLMMEKKKKKKNVDDGAQIHIDKGLRAALWKLKCQGALEMPNCKFAKISLYGKLGQLSLKIDSIQFSKTNRYQPNLHLRLSL